MSEMDAPPKMEQFWEDPPMNHGSHSHGHNNNSNSSGISSGSSTSGNIIHQQQQYERNLNFATGAVEENEYGFPKKKTIRDPLSHRIIEKRRRDRMNNCLADLARLLPPSSLRKGRGRIEKTEIVELAIKHLKHLQCHPCTSGDKCEFNYIAKTTKKNNANPPILSNPHSLARVSSPTSTSLIQSTPESHFRLGFQECMSEAMHFLVEEEGLYPGDGLCVRILKHLTTHSDNVLRDHFGKDGKLCPKEENMGKPCKESDGTSDSNNPGGSGESSLSGYQPQGSSSGSDINGVQDGESFALPGPNTHSHPSTTDRTGQFGLDFEGDNSCESTQLSLDISDVFSTSETKNSIRSGNNPPIPTIICSNSSLPNSHAMHSSSNGRSSDEGQDGPDCGNSSSSNSLHRYKFKNTIKQRFTADLEKPEDGGNLTPSRKGHATKGSLKHLNSESVIELKNSDNEEEETESTKFRNTSSMDLNEDCGSSKSFRDRRNSSAVPNSNGRVISHDRGNSITDRTEATLKSTSMKLAIAPYTSPDVQNEDVKLSREELLKALAMSKLDKAALPLPILFDDIVGDRKSVGVPAFALHDKGLYYIPLTIDKAVLSPYLAKLEPHSPPPLHPVTISVCFLLAPPTNLPGESSGCKVVDAVDIPLNPAELKAIPISHPIVTHSVGTPLVVKPPRNHRDRDSTNNFVINRSSNSQSQSRQYSNGTGYRYPISTSNSYGNAVVVTNAGTGSTVHPIPQSVGQHRNSHQYHPSYYSSSEGGHVSNSGFFPLPPIHVPGYGSSSSSSSSSSGNPSIRSRKRSMCSSPLSGSSSIGYHSQHEKYSPSHDYYPYPSNTHSHSLINHVQSQNHGGHNASIHHSNSNHNYINSNHLVPIHNEKHGSHSDMDGCRRNGSPHKKVKKTQRDTVEESFTSKPMPTITLTSHQ